jgi:hypothetical protein
MMDCYIKIAETKDSKRTQTKGKLLFTEKE